MMDILKFSLHLTAQLKSIDDKPVKEKSVTLQVFDLLSNRWNALFNPFLITDGKLDVIVKCAGLQKTNPIGFEVLKATLGVGTFPHLRLADTASLKGEWKVIFAQFPILFMESDTQLLIDFDESWDIEGSQINRHIPGSFPENEFAIGALPRPNGNHILYPALQAGLLNVKELADFKPYEFVVNLVKKGEDPTADLVKEIDFLKRSIMEKSVAYNELEAKNRELLDKINDADKADESDVLVGLEMDEDGIKVYKAPEAKPARDVYSTIIDEVQSASEKLVESPYKLSNISLNLKTHVVADEQGFKLQLIDSETAFRANQGSFSEVRIDIETNNSPSKELTKGSTPNVLGLTETAARLRLKSFGLDMKTVYQASNNQIVGQAFKQVPLPGNDITPGTIVMVIFAKKTEKIN